MHFRFIAPTFRLFRMALHPGRLYWSRPEMSKRGLSRARTMAIIIEFVGGYHDGGRMSSDSRDEQEATLTRRLYFRATHEGTIGKQFKIISDASVEDQGNGGRAAMPQTKFNSLYYEVTNRIEQGGNIIVRCECVNAVNEPG
jgi:hypothetical protein